MQRRTTLEMEDGTKEDVLILGSVFHDGIQYAVFLADKRKPKINYVYRVVMARKNKMKLEYIDDKEEFDEVCKAVMRQVQKAGVEN